MTKKGKKVLLEILLFFFFLPLSHFDHFFLLCISSTTFYRNLWFEASNKGWELHANARWPFTSHTSIWTKTESRLLRIARGQNTWLPWQTSVVGDGTLGLFRHSSALQMWGGGGMTEPLCSSPEKYDRVWFMISNDGLRSCQRAQTYCIHWSALSAALASLIRSLFSTKGFTAFVLSEWHRCKASIKWIALAESRERYGFKQRKRRKRICCMSKFGLKARRESVLRQKSLIMEPCSCISGEQRSQQHPDACVCVGCVF